MGNNWAWRGCSAFIFSLAGLAIGCSSTEGASNEGATQIASGLATPQDFANLRANYFNYLTGESAAGLMTFSTTDPLLMPKLLNYIVGFYLIAIGLIGILGIHQIRI